MSITVAASPEMKKLQNMPEIQNPLQIFAIFENELKENTDIAKEMKEENKKFFVRMKRRLSNKMTPEEDLVCGGKVAKHFPTKVMKALAKKLTLNPMDSDTRLALFDPFLQGAMKGHFMAYRDIYMQALLELNFNHLCPIAINTALLAQKLYLEALQQVYMEERSFFQQKVKSKKPKSGGARDEKFQDIYQRLDELKHVIEFLSEVQQMYRSKALKLKDRIDFLDLSEAKESDKEMQDKTSQLLGALVALPPLQAVSNRWLQAIGKRFHRKPISIIHTSKMMRNQGKLLHLMYAHSPRKDPSVIQLAGNTYMRGLKGLARGINKVGSVPDAVGKSFIYEFGIACHGFCQEVPLMGLSVPESIMEIVDTAVDMLGLISDDNNAVNIQKLLIKEMNKIQPEETSEG